MTMAMAMNLVMVMAMVVAMPVGRAVVVIVFVAVGAHGKSAFRETKGGPSPGLAALCATPPPYKNT
ncbi:hypothetical protein [Streptomyces virginiae]|uniref:hypothetical protein n=1 Tax=Streptomyces virginiae TaxID=1961 RepID=UPI0036F78DA5